MLRIKLFNHYNMKNDPKKFSHLFFNYYNMKNDPNDPKRENAPTTSTTTKSTS